MDNVSSYKTGKGHVRYKVDLAFTHEGIFHRYRQQGFETAKEAAQWARKRELLIRTGGTVEARTRQSSAPGDDPRGWTVDEVFERLVEHWQGRHKASTIKGNSSAYHCHISPRIGRKIFSQLSQRDLDGIGAGHWRAALVMSTIWKHAAKAGAIMPTATWTPPKVSKPQRLVFLTPDEARQALTLIPTDLRPLFKFLLATGARIGEASGLTWNRIDFSHRLIHIDRQWSPVTKGFTTCKSGKGRTVPMSETALEALQELPRGAGDEFVFPGQRGRFVEAMAKLQPIMKKQVTAHSLRHTFASWAIQANVSITVVARILGQSSSAVTETYVHLQPRHLVDGTSAIDTALSL